MREKSWHLLWGMGLLALYVILHSIQMPLMRLCDSLRHSQTMALMFVGEVVFLTPFVGVIWRKWNLRIMKEWIAVSSLCFSLGAYHAALIYCSQHMHVGK